MINHLSLLAIANASDLSEMVVLSNIMDGVDGAATMYYTHESDGDIQIGARDTVITRLNHTIEAQVLWDSTATTQLNTWRNDQTKVICAGYGIDGGLVWLTPSTISPTQGFDNVHSMGVRITQATLPGFVNDESRSIHVGENLLGLYNLLSGGANYINGFSGTGGTRSGANQSMSASSSINTPPLMFPFVGRSLSFGVNVTARTGTCSMILRALDDAGGTISNATINLNATGDFNDTVVLPAGTASITVLFTTASASTITFNRPYVRLQGARFTLE